MNAAVHRWWWRLAAVVTGAAVLGSLYQLNERRPTGAEAASCPAGWSIPILDSPRISQAEAAAAAYNSVPATSGPHYAFAVAAGVYREPLPAPATVAVLLSGNVVVQYDPELSSAAVQNLERLARRYAGTVVLAPHSGLEGDVAVTAWGCLGRFAGTDPGRIGEFVGQIVVG